MSAHLARLATHGVLTTGEQHALARLLALARTEVTNDVADVLALAFRSLRTGDVCVDLTDTTIDPAVLARIPALVTTNPQNHLAPFVLDDNRLYLARQHAQERALAHAIMRLANTTVDVNVPWLTNALTELFGPPSSDGPNRQRLATAISMQRALTVIAGGPGSGKTFTVTKILALLNRWHEAHDTAPLQVVLAAPTGRAAARLTATLHSENVAMTQPAMTLHRLLHRRLHDHTGRYDHTALAADVVIVDEASMVGLPLFQTLVAALHPTARLILIGDSNQLGSIDTGAVFHELCGVDQGDLLSLSHDAATQYATVTGEPLPATMATASLADVVVRLNVTHRFADAGGVGQAARLLRDVDGDIQATVDALRAREQDGFTLADADVTETFQTMLTTAVHAYNAAANAVLDANDPHAALTLFDRFRILCALHDGPYGTRAINRQILAGLARINPRFDATERFTPGRFVLATRNDASTGVQNGDVGVVVDPEGNGQPQVAFANGRDDVTFVSPYRLDAPDDPYAMSVHKAQGSQFDTVVLLLPEVPHPVATRALVYTAVTRAQTTATIIDPGRQLAHALAQIDRRVSGLSAIVLPATGSM